MRSGEDSAKKSFKVGLDDNDLPNTIMETVQNQYESIVQAHDRVKALRDSYEADNERSSTATSNR